MMADDQTSDDRASTFEAHRPRLFGIAYRMLGAVEDAEDVLQDAYLRWHQAKLDAIRSHEAWLVAVVTRLSIDRLRRLATERAAYVGNWLPEPIATPSSAPDGRAELASDLSMAFLVLLERLAPEERAAFLLREVFGAEYAEIAEVLDKSGAACRQMVHRARERVRRDERRYPSDPDAKRRLLERFVSALAAEDRDGVLSLLAGDVVLVTDGGGKAPSVQAIVRGAERLAQLLVGFERAGRLQLARHGRGELTHEVTMLNGEPATLTILEGRTLFATSFETDGERIVGVYRVLNPDKLRHVGPAPFLPPGVPAAEVHRVVREVLGDG